MKIKRFFAPDIRQAMRMVREEQGPDAVILSNNRVNGGVEIVAAIDYDESMLPGHGFTQPAGTAKSTSTAEPDIQSGLPAEDAIENKKIEAGKSGNEKVSGETGQPVSEPVRSVPMPANVWSQEPTLLEMRSELNTLRRLLESQMSSLAWGSFARGEPRRVELIQRLMQFGMTASQCKSIVESIDTTGADTEQMWRSALDVLARSIPLYGHDILNEGGIVALVGPTGVGKTTTVAKLAARYALCHGNRHVALVTIDNYRVGAYEQLRTYGRILDIPVKIANGKEELHKILEDLSDRRLVLIDTMGMSQNDSGLSRQADILDRDDMKKKVFLLLSATSRHSGLDTVVSAFDAFKPDGCILTKIDESTCLGGALSVAVKHQSPVAYVSDGQRVPEDLHVARADSLVSRAEEIMDTTGPLINEDLMSLSFVKEVADAHF